MTPRDPRSERLAIAVFACSWLYLAFPWLSGRVTIPYDAKALFQAQLQFLATALHSGQSPFWNPYTFAGFPQISDPQSLIFSPAVLIAYLVETPSYGMLDVYVMALLGAGGLAMLMLCLDKGWHPGAAVVAAIAFSFGGSAAWRVQHIGHIQGYVFFIIALWCFLRALDHRSAKWGLAAGLAAGVMLAEPNQVALLGSYGLTIVYVAHLQSAVSIRTEILQTWRPVLAAVAGSLALATIPVALAYLFLQQSNRPSIAFAEAARGSLHPVSLLTFLVADLFGALDPLIDYWGPYSAHWNKDELTLSQNMSQIYSGILPALALATIGFVRGHIFDRGVRVYGVLAAISIVYALGAYTPAYYALHNFIPGVRSFRRPVDATFMFGAMVAVLSGYFVHLWLTNQIRCTSTRDRAAEILIVAGAMAAACGVAVLAGSFKVAIWPLLTTLFWVALCVLLLRNSERWMRGRTSAMIVIPALFLSVDLSIHNAANSSTGVNAAEIADVLQPQTKNKTIAFLKSKIRSGTGTAWRDRVELLGLGFDWQNCSEVHRIESTLGYNPFRIGLVSQALGARDYNVGADQRTFSPLFPSYRSKLADMIGMRFIASGAPLESIDATLKPSDLKLVARTGDAFIYENPRALPRTFLVGAAAGADFDTILRTGRWPDFDPRTTVLLQSGQVQLLQRFAAQQDQAPQPSTENGATIVRYDNAVIEVRTIANDAKMLVLNDIWHPWWFASVDGVEASLVQANGIFRAAPVPPGSHVVRFEFRPFYGAWRDAARRVVGDD
jgi:hypothetical protein